ncbi:hypothetical protein B4U79_08646, partial [Dinothrombium tinctorium]
MQPIDLNEEQSCESAFRENCIKQKQKKFCNQGSKFAFEEKACSALNNTQELGFNSFFDCCVACLNGMREAEHGDCRSEASQDLVTYAKYFCCQQKNSLTANNFDIVPEAVPTQVHEYRIDACFRHPNNCSQKCDINDFGAIVCSCYDGYRLKSNGSECEDINECESNPCGKNEVCENLEASYLCTPMLADGFGDTDNDFLTNDQFPETGSLYDEDAFVTDKCSEEGYRMNGDGHCEDINECEEDSHNCNDELQCKNTDGSFTCIPLEDTINQCAKGFKLVETKCVYIECENLHNCTGMNCTNLFGEFHCNYITKNKRSELTSDIGNKNADERTMNDSNDSETEKCKEGYILNPDTKECEDIDECKQNSHKCGKNSYCKNTKGGFKCMCKEGFEESNRECNRKNEQSTSSDIKECDFGFYFDNKTMQCEDENECSLGIHNCDEFSICINVNGSFECEYRPCENGYKRNFNGSCEKVVCSEGQKYDIFFGKCSDVDECEERTTCNDDENCFNTIGSYKCKKPIKCEQGSKPSIDDVCVDIDECTENTHNCNESKKEICKNKYNGFDCICEVGYKRNTTSGICEDINECKYVDPCPWPKMCENTIGSYKCKCRLGFIEKDGECEDIDECEDENICEAGKQCVNARGNYTCDCEKGFEFGPNKTCVSIDECKKNPMEFCEICESNIGSNQCKKCISGFEIDGSSCKDIDECANNETICGDNLCTNLRGSYRCTEVHCGSNYFRHKTDKHSCLKKTNDRDKKRPLWIEYRPFSVPNGLLLPGGGLKLFTIKIDESVPCEYTSRNVYMKAIDANGEASKDEDWHLSIHKNNDATLELKNSLKGPQEIAIHIDCNVKSIIAHRTVVLIYVSKY